MRTPEKTSSLVFGREKNRGKKKAKEDIARKEKALKNKERIQRRNIGVPLKHNQRIPPTQRGNRQKPGEADRPKKDLLSSQTQDGEDKDSSDSEKNVQHFVDAESGTVVTATVSGFDFEESGEVGHFASSKRKREEESGETPQQKKSKRQFIKRTHKKKKPKRPRRGSSMNKL